MIKIVNVEEENLHIFWITWGISIEILGKMWIMILKVTRKLDFTFSVSLKNTFLEKPQRGSNWPPLLSPSLFRVKGAHMENALSNKTQASTERMSMDIWAALLKLSFQKNKLVRGKTPFFVICQFCTCPPLVPSSTFN